MQNGNMNFERFKDKTLNTLLENINFNNFSFGNLSLGLNKEKTEFIVVDYIKFNGDDTFYVCKKDE